jgi:hypothetical protein
MVHGLEAGGDGSPPQPARHPIDLQVGRGSLSDADDLDGHGDLGEEAEAARCQSREDRCQTSSLKIARARQSDSGMSGSSSVS